MEGLVVSGASKTFSTPEGNIVRALDNVDLTVEANEFVVLLGPSGCGKTTLLRTIAGLENTDTGELSLHGERLDLIPPFQRPVNTVFQSYALFPYLTVERNIAFGLEMEKMPKAEITARVSEMLELVELSDFGSRMPDQLSGGQQQRVALARALAKRPKLLLLDEPLAALDLKLRRSMQVELKRIQRTTGIAFVFVTHDQEEALALGDRIAVMDEGKIMQFGTPQDIYERPESRFVADFIGETNLLTAIKAGGDVRVADQATFTLDTLPLSLTPETLPDGGVSVAVRPERLTISPDGQLGGTVTSVAYLGAVTSIVVELPDGETVEVRQDSGITAPGEGDEVRIALDPRHLQVFS